MTLNLRVFDDLDQLLNMTNWDEFVRNGENPHFLSGFIQQFFVIESELGKKPIVIVLFSEDKVVGVAPIVITFWKDVFKTAMFLTGPDFDPDFIVQEAYREIFLQETVYLLFKKIGCKFVNFYLPETSKNLQFFTKNQCCFQKPYCLIRPLSTHSILFKQTTWNEYEKLRGRNFRKFFRYIERKMSKKGNLNVLTASKFYSQSQTREEILKIEKKSWKQSYREERGIKKDEFLEGVLTAAINTSPSLGFSWDVAFFAIDGKNVAYSFWYAHKDTAYVFKTSFDDEFRQFYPGVYINNVVIRELFSVDKIKKIDLMTDLPFHYRWAPDKSQRYSVNVYGSFIPFFIFKLIGNKYSLKLRKQARNILNKLFPNLIAHF